MNIMASDCVFTPNVVFKCKYVYNFSKDCEMLSTYASIFF